MYFTHHALLIFIAYIDLALPLNSIIYYAFLSTILFVIFLFIRFQKEIKFYHELADHDDVFDLSRIPEPFSPFEKMVADRFIKQTESLRKTGGENDFQLEQEKDEILSWIHEVKTPLTAMHLMIDRLNDHSLKKELTYEWLRIYLLLDQQLHQKRIPFMGNDLYIESTDLEFLIFGEIKNLQSWCIQKGIGLKLNCR